MSEPNLRSASLVPTVFAPIKRWLSSIPLFTSVLQFPSLEQGRLERKVSAKPYVHYTFAQSSHQLTIFLDSPNFEEIRKIHSGKAEFALVTKNGMLLFFCRFESQPWLFSVYQWHRVSAAERIPPDLWNGANLQILARDLVTGQEYLNRTITLDPDFTASLCGSILLQASKSWIGEEEYQAALTQLFHEYSTPESLLPFATARTCSVP